MMTKSRLPRKVAKLGASPITTILLLGLIIPSVAFIASTGAKVALDNLQVMVQTTANLPFQYTLTAYNTSGYQVASFNGNYPQASFGLPDGTYLITAAAYYQQYYYCGPGPCPLASGSTNAAFPVKYIPPEYGYAVVKLTGPTLITITTKNSTEASVSNVPVHVQFANGTSAVGASVSAYLVGDYYYSNSQNWVTYGQTGSNGNVTLVLPYAPIEVNAYMSVPVQLPKNVTTVPVIIGGQKVNVTVYYPTYISLSGQALILPPQKGATITLKYQQSPYPYPVYAAGGVPTAGAVSTVTAFASTTVAGAQAASSSPQSSRIAPFNPTNAQLTPASQVSQQTPPGFGAMEYLIAGVGAAVLVGAAAAVLLSRRNRIESARQ